MACQVPPTGMHLPRRRRFRFSVRALLIATALLGAMLGLRIRTAQRQEAAVRAIRALGGTVFYDYQMKRRQDPSAGRAIVDPNASPAYPAWFRRIADRLFPPRVEYVSLRDTGATDAHLCLLDDLPHVTVLDLKSTRITDRGMVHLSRLPLEVLSLWKTGIGDEGIRQLRDRTALRNVVLDETKVTDAALADVAGWTDLEEWLGLCYTRVTDEGVGRLSGLKKLRTLNLIGTSVTAERARELRAALSQTDISIGGPP